METKVVPTHSSLLGKQMCHLIHPYSEVCYRVCAEWLVQLWSELNFVSSLILSITSVSKSSCNKLTSPSVSLYTNPMAAVGGRLEHLKLEEVTMRTKPGPESSRKWFPVRKFLMDHDSCFFSPHSCQEALIMDYQLSRPALVTLVAKEVRQEMTETSNTQPALLSLSTLDFLSLS